MNLNAKLAAAVVLAALSGGLWFLSRGDSAARKPTQPAGVPVEEVAVASRPSVTAAPTDAGVEASREPAQTAPEPVAAAVAAPALRLPAGDTAVVGAVVDAAGSPFAGAQVSVFAHAFRGRAPLEDGEGADGALGEPLQTATTSEDGRFRFDGLRAFTDYGVRSRAEGFATEAANARAGEELTLRMLPLGRLFGRVLEVDGATPVAGVAIVAAQPRNRRFAPRTTTSATDGSYELSTIGAGMGIELNVYAADGLPFEFQVSLAPRGDTEFDLRLPEREWFSGEVIDADTGLPIPYAKLYAGPTRRQVGVCDDQGRFRIGLSAQLIQAAERRSSSEIQVLHADPVRGGYLSESLVAHAEDYSGFAPLWVAATGTEGEFRLPLARAGRITGRVTHPDGSPAEGVRVGWKETPASFIGAGAMTILAPGERSLTTDADGRFAMESATCNPDRAGILELRYAELDPIEISDASPLTAGGERHHELVLEERPGLPGLLLVNDQPEFGYVYVVAADGDLGRQVRSDPAGNFEMKSLEPGVHVLRACTGDGSAVFSEDHVVEMPYKGPDPFEIHVRSRFDEVRGRVVDTAGNPLAGMPVLAFPQSKRGAPGRGMLLAGSTDTRADGTFHLRFEPAENPGEKFYTIMCHLEGSAQEVADVSAGRDDVEFVMPQVAPVTLKIVAAGTGEPLASARLAWRDLGSRATAAMYSGIAVPTTSGVLAVHLPVGSIDLDVSSPGYDKTTVRSLRIPAGGLEKTLAVELSVKR